MKRLVSFVAAIALAGILAACGRPQSSSANQQPAATVQVPVAAVEKHSVQEAYVAVGTVRAKVASTIQSKMTGHVHAVNVREGDHVEAGQILIEIDPREAEAQVRRAESALREASETRRETEDALQAALHSKAAAAAGNDLAAATFARYKGLAANQAVSRQVYDEADARFKGAAADAARADEMAQSVLAKRGEVEARIEQAKAELSNAQTVLSFAKVTAPFAGIITRKTVDVGDLAAPGTPLLIVEDPRQYRLEAQVDEEQVHRVSIGDKVPVILDSFKGKDFAGTAVEIVPSADPSSRTVTVKIDLPADPALKSGVFGRARFDGAEKEALMIPDSAVVYRGQLTGAYVVGDDQVARLRLITVGKHHGDQVEVLSGLDGGERIVVDKTDQVADGASVQQAASPASDRQN